MTGGGGKTRIPAVRLRHVLEAAAVLAAVLASSAPALAQGYGGTVADHLVRGESLLAQKRPNEAIVQYQEARFLCPTPAESVLSYQGEAQGRINLGDLLPAAGLLEEAVQRFQDDPRAPDMLYEAGILRSRAGEIDKAIDLMRRAIDRKPTPDLLPQIQFALAQILRGRGLPEEVIGLLKDFEAGHPDHPLLPNVLYTLAIAYHDVGRLDDAESTYREILKRYQGRKHPQAYVEAHFELASVLAERHRAREAADYYRKYVTLNPSSELAATALERAGDALFLRSPGESAELYGLAIVKASTNPRPAQSWMAPGRFLGVKRRLADGLSRSWVLVLLGAAALIAVALLGRQVLGRRRRSDPAGA
jgi:tetratricopeptide (TPR) repeat protein